MSIYSLEDHYFDTPDFFCYFLFVFVFVQYLCDQVLHPTNKSSPANLFACISGDDSNTSGVDDI